jgi:hypothetical protein
VAATLLPQQLLFAQALRCYAQRTCLLSACTLGLSHNPQSLVVQALLQVLLARRSTQGV